MPVAIRAITRIQDADDINVALGVGVDEYALVYDYDTAKFVLRAPAAAPDLSGYALLAGRAGGQTLYGGTGANDDLTLSGTSHATKTTSYVILNSTTKLNGHLLAETAGTWDIGAPGASQPRSIYAYSSVVVSATGNPSGVLYPTSLTLSNWNCVRSGSGDGLELSPYAYGLSLWKPQWAGIALFVDASGKVGIGTTAPATALHVVGAATITGGIRPAADSTTALQLQNAAGTSVLNVDTTNARVGIGTTAPSYKLDIDARGVSGFRVLGYSQDGVSDLQRLTVSGGSGYGSVAIDASSFRAVAFNSIELDARSETFNIFTRGQFTSYGNTNLRIQAQSGYNILLAPSGGSVGIGTTSPATRLDIDAGAMTMAEMTAPTGIANKAMLYTKDNGAGKTQLCCKLGDDVEIVIATQA